MTNELAGYHGPALSDYYNASQLRADSWSQLKSDAARIVESPDSPDNPRLQRRIAESLALLEPIERYASCAR